MQELMFSELFTLTPNAVNALIASINSRNNANWNAYKAENPKNIIIPLVGGGAGAPLPINKGGVYVWGFWIECNGKKIFFPLYVGKREVNCVDHILNVHLNATGGAYSCFGTKALFKTPECSDRDCFYDCIEQYNRYLIGANNGNIGALMEDFFNAVNNPCFDWLIFFHNRAFWEEKLPGCATCDPPFHDIFDDTQYQAIDKLRGTPAGCLPANNIADEIVVAQNYLAAHFCFTYMDLDSTISKMVPNDPLYGKTRNILNRRFEKATKVALVRIRLFTMSKAGGPIPTPTNVNFLNLQNNLINRGGHAFGNPDYTNPLLIPV